MGQVSKSTKKPAGETTKAPDVAAPADPRDAELEALRAELARVTAAQEPEEAPEPEREMDAKDHAIAALKAELDALKATPAGAAAEMAKALAALQEQVTRMQSGQGQVPVPVNENPDPFRFGAVLATGEVVHAQHPTATKHYSPEHGIPVPVMSYFELDEETVLALNAA